MTTNRLTFRLLTLLIWMLLFSVSIHAQNINFEWAKTVGGTAFDQAPTITVDAAGNIYSAGRFKKTVDFDPGPGVFNLTVIGGGNDVDMYVQKLDPSGNFVWAKQFGGNSFDEVNAITVDNSGDIIISGRKAFVPSSFDDIFLQKMDSSGSIIWTRTFGSLGSAFDVGLSVTTDAVGNIYHTGAFQSTIDFDPGIGTFNLTSNGIASDMFVQKLDSNGDFIWANSVGGTDTDYPTAITLDDLGNIYTVGYFKDSVDFDPGVGIQTLTSQGSNDMFIQKLDNNGNFIWAKIFGSTGNDRAESVSINASGNVCITGFFELSVDFDPGPGTNILNTNGLWDIFVLQLDANGDFLWAKGIGGSDYDYAYSLKIDDNSNIYLTGFFNDTVDFDPGVGINNKVSNGASDIFVQVLNSSGDLISIATLGGGGGDIGQSIYIGDSGDIYCSGYFVDTVDFNPGIGVDTASSHGNSDIYVLKLSLCTSVLGTETITTCNSITWINGNTYTSSNNTGTHTITGGASNGCDSIVTLDLTITPLDTGVTILLDDNWSANATSGTFQWIECTKDSILLGETSADFAPPTDGSYAVIITDNGCSDTSTCISVQVVGLNELRHLSNVNVYPNPVNQQLTFEFESTEERLITIYSSTGKKVSTFESKGTKTGIDVKELANGFYYYSVQMLEDAVVIGRGSFIKE
ncbi:MAG: T9SS type A sorting domain-containing protein [Flavobacteriales bacterium]|nr:T9SS type A sorting domain-containing protein [Flavobacteriales bacterium]